MDLENQYKHDSNLTIKVHYKCVNKYCHIKNIQKAVRDQSEPNVFESISHPILPKRARRSEVQKFVFRDHCIFCGEKCNVNRDPKHPNRWRPAYVCRQVEVSDGSKTLKEEILDICVKRKDKQAECVRVRIEGAVSDLHAADARYHVDCKSNFMSQRSVTSASISTSAISSDSPVDSAFTSVIDFLDQDRTKIHNTIDLHNKYIDSGGEILSRRQLLSKIIEHFAGDLLALSSPGIATIVTFKPNAAKALHIVSDETDYDDAAIEKVAKKIAKEIDDIEIDRNSYQTHLNREMCSNHASDTVLDLLSRLGKKMSHTLPAIMIGNMITSTMKNLATPLQIGLTVLLHDAKQQINDFHKFGVTCSYDEIRRFKRSAATAANKEMSLEGLCSRTQGMIQGLGDNFDQDIASQNGKIQTHSMALLMTQVQKSDFEDDGSTIPRLKKSELGKEIAHDLDVMRYTGPKKPDPPKDCLNIHVLPLSLLARMALSRNRSHETDFAFFNDIGKDGVPEFNGYNTEKTRLEGQSLQPKTRAVYLPLIDLPPTEYDTMLTSMLKVKQLTEQTGQSFTVFTVDQQLHRITVEIQWAMP